MSTKKRIAANPMTSMESNASKIQDTPNVINGIRLSNEPDSGKVITVLANHGKTGEAIELSYSNYKVIGNGSFGVVFQAKLIPFGEFAAIKRVLQDKRFKNRELQIMRLVSHPNIVALQSFFYSNGEKKDEVFLNLVLEYVPETVYRASRHFSKMKQSMPMLSVKLYMYQLFRSLAYIHSLGICHRDIKPQNLLLDPTLGILKLCDFGSAKILISGEPNVSYICSRYYRAPELIFGSTNYDVSIDIWSSGCVMAELMLGQPLFPGDSGVDQLFPQIKACPWTKVFRSRTTTPESLELIAKLLEYTPTNRPIAIEAMVHPFFDEIKKPETKLLSGRDLPALFDFSPLELSIRPNLIRQLVPPHAEPALRLQGIELDKFQPVQIQKPLTNLND
ncbi:hypothetical protein BASA50_006310 [Batrachochytrium salamandrivorans]|uniref:Protein kinase domain-containing protein n=1 Tax=Batrachochytrium salamandrivorans TaxID=1357716 RepID=A0ABQ8FAD1_9FUNG|nr:hypothetical protein BASA50_006310 [Batrachochytrium salamandrivorans]